MLTQGHRMGKDFFFLFKKNRGVDPAFRLMRFPIDGELDFYFENDFTD